jgi:glycosyltransferase involved in cell wall biosynthesis
MVGREAALVKILCVAGNPPSPRFSGTGIRLFNTVRALASVADVTLVVVAYARDSHLLEDVAPLCREVVVADKAQTLRSLWPGDGRPRLVGYWDVISTLKPSSIRFLDASGLRHLVERLDVRDADCVWISRSWLAGQLEPSDWRRVVVDFDDLEYRVREQTARLTPSYASKFLIERLEGWKQRRFERALSRRVARALVCSEADRQLLGADNVRVLPNCVALPSPATEGEDVPGRLLFVGKMDYFPNIDGATFFCREVLPLIRRVDPRAHLYIVGRDATPDVQALHTGTDVIVTGAVPDVAPYFREAAVVVVPLRAGGGTRLKILEALAFRKAVVSTSTGADGLDLEHGVHLAIADTAPAFAAQCLALMAAPATRRALGDAGRHLVEARYSDDVFRRTVRSVVSEVTGSALEMEELPSAEHGAGR